MAGQILRILPKTDYDYGSLGNSANVTSVVARRVDLSPFREAVICFRLHGKGPTDWNTGAKIELYYTPDGYTAEDPGQAWNGPTAVLLGTAILQTDTVPCFRIATITSPFSGLGLFSIKFTQATAAGAFKSTISIDLVGRE
jgi:hypothetical protein